MIRKNKDPIKLLMYSARPSRHRERIMALILKFGHEISACLFDSSVGFAREVGFLLYGRSIILVLLESENEHIKIQEFKDLLDGHHVILILPDTGDAVMARGMSLYPRYMSYLKDDYQDVYDVLEKMITKIRYQRRGELR